MFNGGRREIRRGMGEIFRMRRGDAAGQHRLNNLTDLTERDITGGTGKFRGIHGIVRAETVSDAKAFNRTHTEFEDWFDK